MSNLQSSLDVPVKVKIDTMRDVDNLPSIDQSCLFTPKSTKKSSTRDSPQYVPALKRRPSQIKNRKVNQSMNLQKQTMKILGDATAATSSGRYRESYNNTLHTKIPESAVQLMNELGSKVSLQRQREEKSMQLNVNRIQKSVDELSYSPRKMRENARIVDQVKGHLNLRASELMSRVNTQLYQRTREQLHSSLEDKIDVWLRNDSKKEDPEHHSRYFSILSKLDMQSVRNRPQAFSKREMKKLP